MGWTETTARDASDAPELEPYKHLIGNYRINLLEIHAMENLDQYTGELKALFGFIKYQKDQERLNEFVQDNEEVFRSVSMETAYAIKVMAGAGEIENYIKQEEDEEKVDMCQALQDMMKESREKGYQEGCKALQDMMKESREKGYQEGCQGLQDKMKESREKGYQEGCQGLQDKVKESREKGYQEGCQGLQDKVKKSREKGCTEGELRKLIELICKKLKKGKSLETIAQELEEDVEAVTGIWEAAKDFGPEYDCDSIFKKLSIR